MESMYVLLAHNTHHSDINKHMIYFTSTDGANTTIMLASNPNKCLWVYLRPRLSGRTSLDYNFIYLHADLIHYLWMSHTFITRGCSYRWINHSVPWSQQQFWDYFILLYCLSYQKRIFETLKKQSPKTPKSPNYLTIWLCKNKTCTKSVFFR